MCRAPVGTSSKVLRSRGETGCSPVGDRTLTYAASRRRLHRSRPQIIAHLIQRADRTSS